MVESRLQIRTSWGHGDGAGLVYYPNYFDWFDQCYQGLLESVGYTQRALQQRWGIVGTGILHASAQFRAPIDVGDQLDGASYVERWGRRSFTVYHRLENGGTLAAEGREVRGWFARLEGQRSKIAAQPIPEEFKRRLGWDAG